MASASTKAAGAKSTLTPSITLRDHGDWIPSICYFPDGQRMVSGSQDKTTRQWDLKAGKEIEEARGVGEGVVCAVTVSRDGRWVITGGDHGELKACEVETGIMKTFAGHSMWVGCVDTSADNTLLASGSWDGTARIWNLDTGKLVAGPFKSEGWIGAVRFSTDSKKLAVKLHSGKRLEIWDVRSQKLDALKVGKHAGLIFFMHSLVIWTNNKTIITAFNFSNDSDCAKTIYEFDALTLETVGSPFEGHTNTVTGLALSFDNALLASVSFGSTIKLWAFESRQLLASIGTQIPLGLILSPDARQLAYTVLIKDDHKIYICDTPPDVLSQARIIAQKKSTLNHLLHSDATRPSAGHRKPPILATPIVQRPPPTRDQQQSSLLRLGKFLSFSPRTNTSRKDRPRDPLDFPATSPLPPKRPRVNSPPSTPLPGGRAFFNPIRASSDKGKKKAREPKRKPVRVVNVPHGQVTYGDAVGVDDGTRPYVLFFCLSWFQKKEKKEEPRPIYDDEIEDDEEEENVPDPVAMPPRVQHEEIELKPLTGQSQPGGRTFSPSSD